MKTIFITLSLFSSLALAQKIGLADFNGTFQGADKSVIQIVVQGNEVKTFFTSVKGYVPKGVPPGLAVEHVRILGSPDHPSFQKERIFVTFKDGSRKEIFDESLKRSWLRFQDGVLLRDQTSENGTVNLNTNSNVSYDAWTLDRSGHLIYNLFDSHESQANWSQSLSESNEGTPSDYSTFERISPAELQTLKKVPGESPLAGAIFDGTYLTSKSDVYGLRFPRSQPPLTLTTSGNTITRTKVYALKTDEAGNTLVPAVTDKEEFILDNEVHLGVVKRTASPEHLAFLEAQKQKFGSSYESLDIDGIREHRQYYRANIEGQTLTIQTFPFLSRDKTDYLKTPDSIKWFEITKYTYKKPGTLIERSSKAPDYGLEILPTSLMTSEMSTAPAKPYPWYREPCELWLDAVSAGKQGKLKEWFAGFVRGG